MADPKATTSAMAVDAKPAEKAQDPQPQLGALEEDDEFEEFAADGTLRLYVTTKHDTEVSA